MANPVLIQKQIKDNAEDLNNFVKDLKLWEEDMKRKDRQLSSEKSNDKEIMPPVRKAKLSDGALARNKVEIDSKKKRIPSYDYKSWEKFDVEKACEEIDNDDTEDIDLIENSIEDKKKYLKEKALYEKELGNQHVKAGKWDAAIEAYTRAIISYSQDPVFYANRALCYIKKKKWEAVETDCTESLKLDSTYVKAYLRRAVAREALSRLEDSKYDLSQVLRLEPGNTLAQRDLQRLKTKEQKEKEDAKRAVTHKSSAQETSTQEPTTSQLATDKSGKDSMSKTVLEADPQDILEPNWGLASSTIEPITKPPHLRSKKSLKRVKIHDVGFNSPKHICARKPTCSIPETQELLQDVALPKPVEAQQGHKPRSNLTIVSGLKDLPPPPKTSVQFHNYWDTIKDNPQLCFRFLRQIAGEQLAEIFKESLESRMLSNIIETLARECSGDESGGPILPYLQGLTMVRRFSTLALFLSHSDKINLSKLFHHCLSRGEAKPSDISHLKILYEM